jgi:hypothetical protein
MSMRKWVPVVRARSYWIYINIWDYRRRSKMAAEKNRTRDYDEMNREAGNW